MEKDIERVNKKRPRKKRRALRITGIVVLVLLLGVGAYGFSIYRSASNALNNAYTEVETTRTTKLKGEPISVLLLGIDRDEGRGSGGRSDTMMVVTINPNENSTKIVSIARDTRTEIVGHGTVDKINHAYAFGGAQMSINTVENLLDIPIDYYAEIDMDGFLTLIDVVDGITVENTYLEFTENGYNFPLGTLNLNSQEALAYSRMRYQDPNGDYGRQARQRDVVAALANKMASYAVTRYSDILDSVGGNMKTNLTMSDITSISLNYHSAIKDIEQLELRGTGTMIGGVSYQVVSDETLLEMQNLLKAHLEL